MPTSNDKMIRRSFESAKEGMPTPRTLTMIVTAAGAPANVSVDYGALMMPMGLGTESAAWAGMLINLFDILILLSNPTDAVVL